MAPSRSFAFFAVVAVAAQRGAAAPRTMMETGPLLDDTADVTNVIDAFDADDPFDLRVGLGYSFRSKVAKIRRESNLYQPGLTQGRATAWGENVAQYTQLTHALNLRAEAGLWKDLALRVKLPIVLSDSRALGDLEGSQKNPERRTQADGTPLFSLPFESPSRSGLDWIGLELVFGLTNQRRSPALPTWTTSLELQLPIGDPLQPCSARAATRCPDPFFYDPQSPSAQRESGKGPGLNRGMTTLIARTSMSRRSGDVEPYGQLSILADFPTGTSLYTTQDAQKGVILTMPPIVATVVSGVEVVASEEREHGRSLVVDLQGKASYISPGRDYSELFDALGSSAASSLRSPNAAGFREGPLVDGRRTSVADPTAGNVYFTGITDIAQHIALGGRVALRWQPGRFVLVALGAGLQWVQGHAISGGDECNTNKKDSLAEAGNCKSESLAAGGGTNTSATGIPNPNFRPSIDSPARRFRVDDTLIVDLSANLAILF